MRSRKQTVSRIMWSVSLVILMMMLVAVLSGCAKRQISKDESARNILSTVVKEIWDKADQRKGLRVHQYAELLPKGTRVQPASAPDSKESPVIVCENPCWLFFIDEDPSAHFTHPVRIIVVDAKTKERQSIETDRWPQVDGKPVFDTFEKRRDPKTIIFDKPPETKTRGEKPGEIIGGSSRPIKTHDPCDAWAVIVCGWDDLPDTFDEDTDDMYSVLIGLGLLDDHIFFVSPHTTHAGVDRATSVANVQWAINQVAASTDETDKVLFFFSSHGGIDKLYILNFSNWITAANLDTWLDAITCEELTIIIEACHSGSLIGRYKDGSYVAAEDNLTGDGETNRAIFTSASTNTSSYPDVDGAGDPNPGDVGSETIHGYVEAFSVAAADGNLDGEISFNEGWQYAWDNDITRINGTNMPQMMHTGLIASNVYNYCYRVSGDGDLFVADGPGDVGHNSHDYNSTDIWVTQDPTDTDHHDVVSGMDNLVHVAVHNRGTTPIANISLKVYWGDVSTATLWPSDFHQIGSTHTFSSLASGGTHTHTWTWYVDPSIGLGHQFCLIAVADSPDDPMTGGPPGVTYVAAYDNNIAQKNITIIEDPGHGHGAFDFVLKNNTRQFESVDLVIEWVGNPWGTATLILPEDLFNFMKQDTMKLENLKIVDVTGEKVPGFAVGSKGTAKMKSIPIRPAESHVVSLAMQTVKTEPGERSELRLRQEVADSIIIGAVTARLQQVDPADCGWVTRTSVEVFADLALKVNIDLAKEVSRLFAETVSRELCGQEKELYEVLSRALSLESDVERQLAASVDEEARGRFISSLKELEKAINARQIKEALKAQGMISEAVRDL